MKMFYAAAVFALATCSAAAQTMSAPGLLDAGREAQLERWLGAGDQVFTPLFTGVPGDTSLDFHAAVDGKGPTFTLLQVSNSVGSWLVGGYNPQSWSSTDGYHLTPTDAERTAFLFNLTTPAVYRQVSATYVFPSQGLRQTYNAPNHGPAFGQGPDLLVNDRLDMALSWQVSYGDPLDQGKSIIDRSLGGQIFHIDALQLFVVSPVPEPIGAGMLAAGLGLFALLARRRRVRVREVR
jgi:hypothetical protein